MDDIREKKNAVRNDMIRMIQEWPPEKLAEKTRRIEEAIFDFANFVEARIPLLYAHQGCEVAMSNILRGSIEAHKIVVLPTFNADKRTMGMFKVDNLDTDLREGPRGVKEPDPSRCKKVPIDRLDIAIIPGYAFDEKGGRVGSGRGYYDRLIPRLSITTRKVALAFEEQILPQVPMESHDKYVDIIITDQRIIYKI